MKSVLKKLAQATMLLPFLVAAFSLAAPAAVLAQNCDDVSGGISAGADCAAPTTAQQPLFGPDGVFVTVTNILIFIIGAIAVIMLIVGGIRYVLSQGDQGAVTSAKNTILYAVIGIVVALLAYGAVSFVTAQFK